MTIVTLGVCVKNSAATIKKTIDSITSQDFPHESMELIVVVGQGHDGTLDILKNLLPKMEIKNLLFYENKGLGFARQLVIDHAKSRYVVWVDGDVVLPREFVRRQVEFMNANNKIGVASGSHGVLPDADILASLEDLPYIAVDFMLKGEQSSRFPGAAGSIYRLAAIREVGGFDLNLKGAGEDTELAYRIKRAGWLVYIATNATYFEHRKSSWIDLWKHYVWYGHGARNIFRKNNKTINLYAMTPFAGFVAGAWYSVIAYRVTHKKRSFLLPLHYAFKRTAWFIGFTRNRASA